MIKFDEKFLEEVGLGSMPEGQKQEFLQHIQDQLELRVGEKMSENMSVDQMEEFDGIMKNDRQIMSKVLRDFGGDYRQDPLYLKVMERHKVTEATLELIGEYLSIKWIQTYRPNYSEVADNVAKELKEEIIQGRERILQTI